MSVFLCPLIRLLTPIPSFIEGRAVWIFANPSVAKGHTLAPMTPEAKLPDAVDEILGVSGPDQPTPEVHPCLTPALQLASETQDLGLVPPPKAIECDPSLNTATSKSGE